MDDFYSVRGKLPAFHSRCGWPGCSSARESCRAGPAKPALERSGIFALPWALRVRCSMQSWSSRVPGGYSVVHIYARGRRDARWQVLRGSTSSTCGRCCRRTPEMGRLTWYKGSYGGIMIRAFQMAETQGIAEQSEICLVLTAREDVACTEAVLECIYI